MTGDEGICPFGDKVDGPSGSFCEQKPPEGPSFIKS